MDSKLGTTSADIKGSVHHAEGIDLMCLSVKRPILPTNGPRQHSKQLQIRLHAGLSMCTRRHRLRTRIHKIHNGPVRYARVGLQAYFASTAVGVADLDAGGFNLRAQLAKGIGIELRMGHALVAGKTTAAHSLWHKHL